MQSTWNKHIFPSVPVHVCGCVCRRWGAVGCKCNSDGEISSRCVTAAHKVSAAVIRIPLNREEEQPTLPTANVSAAHSPAGRPRQLPTAPILTVVKKKNLTAGHGGPLSVQTH